MGLTRLLHGGGIGALIFTSGCIGQGPAPLPYTPPTMPEFAQQNLAEITAPALAERQWPQVKIPGLPEQVFNAHVNGIDCVWQNISPGYANVVYDAKVDDGVITITLDGGGLAQSVDGGKTWRQISHGMSSAQAYFQSFDISPVDPKIILSAATYLDRTLDGGKTWSTVFDPALPPFALGARTVFDKVRFTSDGSRVFVSLGSFGHGLEPRHEAEAWMAAEYRQKRVYVGDATGSNFTAFDLGPFAGIRVIYPHPKNPDLVYLAFADGELFVTRNATAETPAFAKLEVPPGCAIIDIDASPWQDGELLLTLMPKDKAGAFKVMLAKDSGGNRLECVEVAIKDKDGAAIRAPKIVMAKWNPRVRGQVFVGAQGANGLIVSDDDMKTFRQIPFPDALKHAEPLSPDGTSFYAQPQKLYFDRKTDLAVTCSAIGAWHSTDQFRTWNDLLMTYDEKTQLYGNKGAGFAECAISPHIRKDYAYMAINDHGVLRSDGADYTKWRRISTNPGVPRRPDGSYWAALYFPMYVSADEKYIYVVAREAWPNNPYSNQSLKLLLSTDRGENWQDVTTRLGQGETLNYATELFGVKHGELARILIDPDNTENHWILFSNNFFRSADGGRSFTETTSPTFGKSGPSYFREIAFDPTHQTLYIGNHFTAFAGGASLARSRDLGATWEPVQLGIKGIYGLGVTTSGTLVLGVDGKLLVVPYDRIDGGKIEESMVKMTLGDTVEEMAAQQRTFRPIVCDGEDIVAIVHNTWNRSNFARNMGPLLSRDGGKTFQWITYNLPCTEGVAIALGGGTIIMGSRGIYGWKYKDDKTR
jgi:hypothetical protein